MATVDIKVPQKDGEIAISQRGDIDAPTVYDVKSHKVTVDETDASHFLSVIDGAELVGGQRAATAVAEAADQT